MKRIRTSWIYAPLARATLRAVAKTKWARVHGQQENRPCHRVSTVNSSLYGLRPTPRVSYPIRSAARLLPAFVVSWLFVLARPSSSSGAAAPKRPNFLFILTDDQGLHTPQQHQRNLAGDARHADKLREMEALLLAEMRRHGDLYRLWNQPRDGQQAPKPRVAATKQ
jgi:hypothetical protein